MSSPPRPRPIPPIYRLTLTTIEPVLAVAGALQALLLPHIYTSTMTRGAVPYLAPAQFLYTGLAGGWLLLAFNEAVVLRFNFANDDNPALWRAMAGGMLLSDAATFHSAAQAVGGWAAWVRVGEWEGADWMVFLTTVPFFVVRVMIVLGVGLQGTARRTRRRLDERAKMMIKM